MIRNSNNDWQDICEINPLKVEFKYLGDIPVLIARDFFTNPDAITEFFSKGHWWENGTNEVMAEELIRPGKSLYFHEEVMDWFAAPILAPFLSLLGVKAVKLHSINGNCFNGDMPLDNLLSAFPHTDVPGGDFVKAPQIAFNIGLTKERQHLVQTGFWSFDGKKSKLDFSFNDESAVEKLNDYILGTKDARGNTWFQIKDFEQYKLEEIVNIDYNSLVAYPTHYLHNPYMEPHWFTGHDRVTIAGFLGAYPEDLDFEDNHLEDVSYAWEFFQLDKIHNFHPKKTKIICD